MTLQELLGNRKKKVNDPVSLKISANPESGLHDSHLAEKVAEKLESLIIEFTALLKQGIRLDQFILWANANGLEVKFLDFPVPKFTVMLEPLTWGYKSESISIYAGESIKKVITIEYAGLSRKSKEHNSVSAERGSTDTISGNNKESDSYAQKFSEIRLEGEFIENQNKIQHLVPNEVSGLDNHTEVIPELEIKEPDSLSIPIGKFSLKNAIEYIKPGLIEACQTIVDLIGLEEVYAIILKKKFSVSEQIYVALMTGYYIRTGLKQEPGWPPNSFTKIPLTINHLKNAIEEIKVGGYPETIDEETQMMNLLIEKIKMFNMNVLASELLTEICEAKEEDKEVSRNITVNSLQDLIEADSFFEKYQSRIIMKSFERVDGKGIYLRFYLRKLRNFDVE